MEDNDDAMNKRSIQEGLRIAKISREDLEDKYLNLYDENIILKKHARKQEDKIKKMATKLIKLANDKKKIGSNLNDSGVGAKRMRDIDSEELISELQSKVYDLEQQNKKLKENLQISKIQLQSLQAQKNPVSNAYSNVTSRIDTGLPKRDPSFTKNIRTVSTNRSGNLSSRSMATPNYNSNNNNNNIRQIQHLEYENVDLKSKIDELESHIDSLNEQLIQQRYDHEEELTRLRSQVSQEHVATVQENIDQIRLQRELKDKANQFTELYTKFTNLTQQQSQLKDKHDRLLDELDRSNILLKQEQQKNVSIKTELKNSQHNYREIVELRERIEDLTRENQVLNEANQKLVSSAFSLDREREFRERERSLKIQIAQLEATMKADVGEKGSILDKLNSERDQYDKLNTELREMQIKYYEMKQKYDEMSEKMQFLSKESNIDFTEIEEAIILVKERKANKVSDEFFGMVDSEKIKAYQRKIVDLECTLAETVSELDKSKHLLITQVKINEDYKKEMKLIEDKMEENKAEFEAKKNEAAQMLDIRAARIKKLERQLRDIAYGTKQVRIPKEQEELTLDGGKRRNSYSFVGAPEPHMLDSYITSNLERGQNIFEIHLTKLTLTPEGLRLMNENDPSTFCTIEFYEHEIQSTPVIKGQQAEYNFTSQYVIKVDDFFLHYLQKKTSTIEIHQAIGSDYETRAACQLSFRDLIDREKTRIHGQVELISVVPNNTGITLGVLEYWARLIVPVDQAFRLYKERVKALGYIASNNQALGEVNIKKKSDENMNELNVNILRCAKLSSINTKEQPSAYCVYKFYDFEDQDTEIIKSSNNPEFNSHKSFPVQMDMDLDKYLKNSNLEIYVFDDNQDTNDPSYLGMARVELIRLSHDQEIKGSYELKREDGSSNGTIDVTLYWQYTYLPPSASTFSASGSKLARKLNEKQNILERAVQMSFKNGTPKGPSPALSKQGSRLSSKPASQNASRAASQVPSQIGSQVPSQAGSRSGSKLASPRSQTSPNEAKSNSKKNSDSDSIGNATLYRQPDTNAQNEHFNDTFFGENLTEEYQKTLEKNRVSDNDEEINEEIEDNVSTMERDRDGVSEETLGTTMRHNFRNYVATTKSDDVVTGSWDPNDTNAIPKNGDENNIIIEINSLKFNEGSQVLERDDIKRIFVGMEVPGYEPTEFESDDIPKPKEEKHVHFNFRNCFPIDPENNLDKRDLIAQMIKYPNKSLIRLVVVSLPDNQEDECEEIANAFIDINDILKINQDFINQELNLYDPNDNNSIIGKMVVTVEMLTALISIKNELEANNIES